MVDAAKINGVEAINVGAILGVPAANIAKVNGADFPNEFTYPYPVENSCLFTSNLTRLTRTPGSSTNRRTYVYSCWCKLWKDATSRYNIMLCSDDGGNNRTSMSLAYGGDFVFTWYDRDSGGSASRLDSVAIHRDFSSHYHVYIAVDTTQAVAADRLRVFINAVEITDWTTSDYPVQNKETWVNHNQAHYMGYFPASSSWSDFYLSEPVVLDGATISTAPVTSFGADTDGIWTPKDVSGLAFGTNGFYLDFQDAANLGDDVSGNTNHWAETGMTSANQSTDTPTNNFCTLNPLGTGVASATITEGNLHSITESVNHNPTVGTMAVSLGKWYWEVYVNAYAGGAFCAGVTTPEATASVTPNTLFSALLDHVGYYSNGTVYRSTSGSGNAAAYSATDILQVALDMDNGKVWFGKNGSWTGDPAAGTDEIASGLTGKWLPGCSDGNNTNSMEVSNNFGGTNIFAIASGNADDNGYGNFEYAPPTGFMALCSANMTAEEYVTSGTFTANANVDGPFVYTGCYCPTVTIAGTDYVHGVDSEVDFLSNGFKLRTAGTPNASGTPAWSIDTADIEQDFKNANAQEN